MNVALSWWHPTNGGSQQAIRGNVKALREAGHDVTLYYANEISQMEADQAAYDFVLIPYPQYPGDLDVYEDTHVHLQLGGFAADPNPGQTLYTARNVDTVSVLDPSYVDFLSQHVTVNKSNLALIPNAPNFDLFSVEDHTNEFVLVAGIGSAQKPTTDMAKIARQTPDLDYKVLYNGEQPPEIGEDNVFLYPAVPFTQMPEMYKQASAVLNPSKRDVLPNTAFEAFITGTPYVVRNEAIGFVQSVEESFVDLDAFGSSVADWMDQYKSEIGSGRHFANGRSNEDIARSVRIVHDDDDTRQEVVEEASDFMRTWHDWTWQRKGEVLTEVVQNDGPLG